MKNFILNKDVEGIFKLQMKNFASASVSVYSVLEKENTTDESLDSLLSDGPLTLKGSSKTHNGEKVYTDSIYYPYDEAEWNIENVRGLTEIITTLCDLYPDAYVGNMNHQEIIVSNFVSLTRGLSLYLPDMIVDDFNSRAEEVLEDTGEELDIEEEILISGTIFTKFYIKEEIDGEESEDILAAILSVLITCEDVQMVINFTFNRSLSINDNKFVIDVVPIITDNKKIGYDYLMTIFNKDNAFFELEEESTTYVSVFNKIDYAQYNFIYAMNNLFVETIVDNPSVYRALKPLDYFVITDVLVNMNGDVLVTDNHCLSEFIEDNNLSADETLLEEIRDFGDGFLRVLVTFDKFDALSDELVFVNTHISDYSANILDKYMGVTFVGSTQKTLRNYVEEHYTNLCKLVGNPNNLKDRQFIDIEDAPIVNMDHMLIRDITEIPLWVYLVAIPYVLTMCNELDDEELVNLAEYEETGLSSHPKFMETVYMVKELLSKPWN